MPGFGPRRSPRPRRRPTRPDADRQAETSADASNAERAESLPPSQSEGGLLDFLLGGGDEAQEATAAASAPAEWARVESGQLLLRRGSRGDAVSHLQSLLGLDLVDGIFGRGTQAAVREFQASKGLVVDGIVGGGTAGALTGGSAPSRAQERATEADEAVAAARGGGGQESATEQGTNEEGPNIRVNPASFTSAGLRPEVLSTALDVFRTAWNRGDTTKMIYTVIDFSLPSTEKRMWVIDLEQGALLYHELVTHGARSGGNRPTDFSNVNGSNKSSIGLARTAETYHSSKFGGTALRMDGLEEGYNDNMRRRAIVMHQATYATPEAIAANGGSRLGRSQGCPALDPRVAGEIIETVKNGSLIFSYYPDPEYMAESEYVNGRGNS